MESQQKMMKVLNRLAKWRSVFAGWQLGTRLDNDPECQAVRDHREATIMLRVEVSALTELLIRRGVFTIEEFNDALANEAEQLDADYAKRFPGITSSDHGMVYDPEVAARTMKGWRP
jgi:hypothetical protein